MKIIIPTNNEEIAEHFGKSENYTILNDKGEVIKKIKNNSNHNGGNKLPPIIMKEQGADTLLCKGIGPRAINLCKQLGIKVYIGTGRTVKELYDQWKKGLKQATINESCENHK